NVTDQFAELRIVEYFPPDILESPNNTSMGKGPLDFLGAAGVPRQDEVGVVSVERVGNVEVQLALEVRGIGPKRLQQTVAQKHRRQRDLGEGGGSIVAGLDAPLSQPRNNGSGPLRRA